jgi:hypothetical protein
MLQKINNYLTDSSKEKLKYVLGMVELKPPPPSPIYPKLQQLFHRMQIAGTKKIIASPNTTIRINGVRNSIKKFISDVQNASGSKLESDLNKMNGLMGMLLDTGSGTIKLNFIYDENLRDNAKYIGVILHAVNTFCQMFEHNYNGLEINICLDLNERSIKIPNNLHLDSVQDKITYLQSQSAGLTVSGVTYGNRKVIVLTKREEMVKLLFHEMVHLVGLDNVLLSAKFLSKWAIANPKLNLSEAYAEFMSVLLVIAYESLQLGSTLRIDPHIIFQQILTIEMNYGLYLTSNILKFYGYDQANYQQFFNGTGKKINQPIMLWEYIFLRTILLLDLDSTMNIIPNDYKITKRNIPDLVKIFSDDTILIKNLEKFMSAPLYPSVSYLAIDLDWAKF